MIEVFFNRPGKEFPRELLENDVRRAKTRLAVASAWFSDEQISRCVVACEAPRVIVVLSKADMNRDGAVRVHSALDAEGTKRGKSHDDAICSLRDAGDWDTELPHPFEVHTLGSGDWKEGVMHHKFVVADDVVWCGSYNYTYQARKNYETILRIRDAGTASVFWNEAECLAEEWSIWNGTTQYAFGESAFRCADCERICSNDNVGLDGDSYKICRGCAKG